jgi:hypothetical protein
MGCEDTWWQNELRQKQLYPDKHEPLSPAESEELAQIEVRLAQRAQAIECPALYGVRDYQRDEERLDTVTGEEKKRPPQKVLTEAEEVEAAQIIARMAVYEVSREGRGRQRRNKGR